MWRFVGTGLALSAVAWALLLWVDRVYGDVFGGWFVPLLLLALPLALLSIATSTAGVIRGRGVVCRIAGLLAAALSAYATFVVLVSLLLAIFARNVAVPFP
jgi:hypothetical protein